MCKIEQYLRMARTLDRKPGSGWIGQLYRELALELMEEYARERATNVLTWSAMCG
jgi:hypothetical protein